MSMALLREWNFSAGTLARRVPWVLLRGLAVTSTQNLEAVNVRQADVQGHDIEPLVPHDPNAFFAVVCRMNCETGLREYSFQKIAKVLVIFYYYSYAHVAQGNPNSF
jgi:hypothetical protein